MPIRIVQSKQNTRLKELRKALARPGPNERGLVAIEGPNLLEEALRAGIRIESIFVGDGYPVIEPAQGTSAADVDVMFVPADYLNSILSTETPQPYAALVEPPDWTWAHVLQPAQKSPALLLILAGIQDPGNLGAIIRSAEAFGAAGIICLPGTVNAWNPKAVRASAGSVFRVPVLNAREDEAIDLARNAGLRVLTTAAKGAQPPDAIDLASPVALLIGNEGNGVSADLAAKADGAITIPCPGRVESLNAAVATSVLLYEAERQRADKRDRRKLRGGMR